MVPQVCPYRFVRLSQHGRIEHPAKAIFLSRGKDCLMPMFTVYLDASGNPDNTPALTVAGFIATTEQWIRLEKRWLAVLKEYGVSALHMKDYAHSKREFESWKGDEKKRARFLNDLIAVIQPRVRHSFACTLWIPDYQAANIDNRLRKILSPLAVAGTTCISRIQSWAERNGIPKNNILYIAEDGDIDKGEFSGLRSNCVGHQGSPRKQG
jgi:hypothetical protein